MRSVVDRNVVRRREPEVHKTVRTPAYSGTECSIFYISTFLEHGALILSITVLPSNCTINRHRFFLVSLSLKANAEMVPKIPSCHYMLLM